MGSKLKAKTKPRPTRPPLSNQRLSEIQKAAFATRKDLEVAEAAMKQKIYFDVMQTVQEKVVPEVEVRTWMEAEKWSNFINSLTLLTAVEELFKFGGEEQGAIIEKANELTHAINDKVLDMHEMIRHLEDNGMVFPADYKELVGRYGPQ